MENGWKLESIEMKDKWKDHGWKAWKWSVTRLTLHSAKAELAKVAKVAKVGSSFQQPGFYLSGQTECRQNCSTDFKSSAYNTDRVVHWRGQSVKKLFRQ